MLAAVLVPLLPGPAWAERPYLHEHFGGDFSSEEGDPIVCKNSANVTKTYSEEGSFHGQDLIKAIQDSSVLETGLPQAFLAHSNYSFTVDHENLATGVGFSVKGNGVFRELTGELQDIEDYAGVMIEIEEGVEVPVVGPVYRFTAVEVAHVTIRNDAGRLVYNERGRILWEAVFDTRGDGEPGGLLISEQMTVLSGTFPFFEFCDKALQLAP